MTTFSVFDAAAILIVLASILGFINHKTINLPSSVGMTLMGSIASIIVICIDLFLPETQAASMMTKMMKTIDFHEAVMNGMISFLIFAGALHVDLDDMKNGKWPILIFSTIGVVVSTILVGTMVWITAAIFNITVPLIWCFAFGALISPTDPVAVMSVMKKAEMPKTLQATVAGESLFNDGVGVVVFGIVLSMATGSSQPDVLNAGLDFVRETGGGIVIGSIVGFIAYFLMKNIDDYNVETMLSIAVVMGGYALSHHLHVSGPVAMAVSGLIIGNIAVVDAMSEKTQDYIVKFWILIDEILNAVLFLLIGLEIIALIDEGMFHSMILIVIPIVLLSRFLSIKLPFSIFSYEKILGKNAVSTLVWGGMRGGISIAMALSLPENEHKAFILLATYVCVMFSVVIQGLTIERVISSKN